MYTGTFRMSHNFLLLFGLVLLAATMQQALSYLGHSLDDHPMLQFLGGDSGKSLDLLPWIQPFFADGNHGDHNFPMM